jgi:hypothetical protein
MTTVMSDTVKRSAVSHKCTGGRDCLIDDTMLVIFSVNGACHCVTETVYIRVCCGFWGSYLHEGSLRSPLGRYAM